MSFISQIIDPFFRFHQSKRLGSLIFYLKFDTYIRSSEFFSIDRYRPEFMKQILLSLLKWVLHNTDEHGLNRQLIDKLTAMAEFPRSFISMTPHTSLFRKTFKLCDASDIAAQPQNARYQKSATRTNQDYTLINAN